MAQAGEVDGQLQAEDARAYLNDFRRGVFLLLLQFPRRIHRLVVVPRSRWSRLSHPTTLMEPAHGDAETHRRAPDYTSKGATTLLNKPESTDRSSSFSVPRMAFSRSA